MDTQQETILQAVVLADPFEHQVRYGPLVRGGNKDGEGGTGAQPWCLLPLLNAPIIAWTLECLAASGVKNCFIVIKDGAKELQDWLDSSTFTSPTATMSIKLRSTMASTEGDVMREVDGLALTGDYLLAKAGFIGNLDLEKAVSDFTAKRKKDPGLLMECLVSTRSNGTSSRSSTHVLTPSHQLLHYTNHPRFPRRQRSHFPVELFETCKELCVRTDLESVGIDICNMEVPALFVENFDYQSLRPDFINGVLTSDLLGKTISASVVGAPRGKSGMRTLAGRAQEWAAYVGDLASYHQVSRAILSRWSYPLVPDEMIPGTLERYEQRRGRLYVGKHLNLARSCTVGSASIIGDRTYIGDNSKVYYSVLGQGCRVGANVVIKNSYVFEGVSIEEGCTISDSIVGQGVRVKADSEITDGCLIGPGVTIGEKATLRAYRVSAEPYSEDADEQQTPTTSHAVSGLGVGSQGHIWPSEEEALGEEQDSDDEDALDPRNLRISSLHDTTPEGGYASDASTISTISRSSSSSSLVDSGSEASDDSSADGSDFDDPPAIAGISALDTSDAAEDAAFLKECVSSLERSFSEGHTVDNASIELKTLRMASNVSLKQVIGVVVPFLCDQAKVNADAPAAAVGAAATGLVERWGTLVTGLTGGQENGMVDALLALQQHCATKADIHPRLFPAFLQAYYEEDVVSEEAVVTWVKDPAARKTGGEAGMKLWQTGAAFAKALMEADSDDDEEDDDDESD